MARKGGNIYKRKDGRWEARFVKGRVGGRTRFGYVFGRTYREAREKQAAALCRWQQEKREAEQSKATVETVARQWLEEKACFLRASTVTRYRDCLACHILPRFGRWKLDALTNDDVAGLCHELLQRRSPTGKGLSPHTAAVILSVLKQLRQYAMKRGIAVRFSPESAVVRQPARPIRVFSLQEQMCLLAYLRNHLTPCHLGILLCLYTGIRLGELCALRWEHVSLDAQELRITATMQRIRLPGKGTRTQIVVTPPKSSCSLRTIPLANELCTLLATHRQETGYLLTGSESPCEPRTVQNRFKALLAACRIGDANFHALRHTFATRCIEAGVDAKCLSEILGHASVNITLNRYVHPSMDLKRESLAKLIVA